MMRPNNDLDVTQTISFSSEYILLSVENSTDIHLNMNMTQRLIMCDSVLHKTEI